MRVIPYFITVTVIIIIGGYFAYNYYSNNNIPYSLTDEKNQQTLLQDEIQNDNSNTKETINNLNKLDQKIPKVDIIKVEPDGSFVIAGAGKPNSEILILEKGKIIESAKVDKSGTWAIISNKRLSSGDNLIVIDQNNQDGTHSLSREIYVTKIDKKNKSKPMVVAIPNQDGGKIQIIQKPSKLKNSEKEKTFSVPIVNKLNLPLKTFRVDSIFFNELGNVSIQGKANFGSYIDLHINNIIIKKLYISSGPEWKFNSLKVFDFGQHRLKVILRSKDNNVLKKIELPFMRVKIPEWMLPEDYVIIKPGDILWSISYRIYGNPFKYIEIYKENKDQISNPDLIFPGQIFALPKEY